MTHIVTFLVGGLLIYAGYSDLRHLRIPNWITLALIASFLLLVPTLQVSEVYARLVFAGSTFGIGFILFAVNALGGGDVKLFSAMLLFIPSVEIASFMLVFSAMLFVGIATIVTMRQTALPATSKFKSINTPGVFPMGISISSAGLVGLLAPMLPL